LIIVDDGSSDRTLQVLAGFDDPRLRIHTREHRGLAVTRNEALALARGEFVAWMDADDISHPSRLEAQLQ
jgi:glycosyltransferase involved in cell wall biosynthesis